MTLYLLCITAGSSMITSNFPIPAIGHIKLALKPVQAITKVTCHLPELTEFQHLRGKKVSGFFKSDWKPNLVAFMEESISSLV